MSTYMGLSRLTNFQKQPVFGPACSYAASIGTTMDDLEWPSMTVLRIAPYLCGSWSSCFMDEITFDFHA